MRKREESVRKKGIAVRRNLSKKCEENIRGKFMQSVIKNKKLLAIVLVLVLAIFTIMIATNQEIRKNMIQVFTGDIQNAEENEKVEVYDEDSYDDDSALLTDDAGIITSANVTSRVTGTAPFDTDDQAGNDSSPDNDIVRSFDKITWNIEAKMEINNTGHGSNEVDQDSKYRGGIINIEASLPKEYEGQMKWLLEDMSWTNGTGKLSEDGLTFTAQYQLNENVITVPGEQTLPIVLQILGAGNNTEINPNFKLWMQGNESNEENEGYEAIEIQDNLGEVKISAKGGYNIKIAQNGYCTVRTKVDFEDGKGEVSGRMYGFGVILQLYGDNEEKGLKGIEAPKGDINFDINVKLESIDEKQVTTDITEQAMPQLWNYKINIGDAKENPTYGNIPDRNMYFGDSTAWSNGYAPDGMAQTDRTNSIYDSGNILMEQEGKTIKTTINDYAFDGIFPKYNKWYNTNAPAVVYDDNIGCFSAGYFQLFVPDNEATTQENKRYYVTVESSNMKVETQSGEMVTEQKVSTDDSWKQEHYYIKPAIYGRELTLYEDNINFGLNYGSGNSGNGTYYGKGRKSRGQIFQLRTAISQNSSNDMGTEIKSFNELVKFDGDGLEPILQTDGGKIKIGQGSLEEYNVYYLTKKDGTNWINQEERNNASIKDLIYYNTLEEIPEGNICIGMYIEGNIKTDIDSTRLYIRMKIKDTAIIGKTYGMVHDTDYYLETLDRDTQTITNPDAVYPDPIYSQHKGVYNNVEYDENGEVIEGTHQSYNIGNSLVVVGGESTISIKSIDETTGEEKQSYDIGRNENIVTFKVEPKLEEIDKNNPAEVKGATITIKNTLGNGLTYVPGSANYGEPIERIMNDDGTTTLVWEKYNCNVGEEIETLIFKAEINPTIANETTITNTVVIEPDKEKIGLTALEIRKSVSEIKIVNLVTHRIFQQTDAQIIENNGEIKYTVTYENKTASNLPDFQLLNVLPNNGDGRGTA